MHGQLLAVRGPAQGVSLNLCFLTCEMETKIVPPCRAVMRIKCDAAEKADRPTQGECWINAVVMMMGKLKVNAEPWPQLEQVAEGGTEFRPT